jgi:hypothetical protein
LSPQPPAVCATVPRSWWWSRTALTDGTSRAVAMAIAPPPARSARGTPGYSWCPVEVQDEEPVRSGRVHAGTGPPASTAAVSSTARMNGQKG